MTLEVEGAPEWLEVVTAEERPALWQQMREDERFSGLWPEYNGHGIHTPSYFGALTPRFAHLQALLLDARSGEAVARARTIPFHWAGTLEDLPEGIDAAGLRALDDDRAPTVLSALAAEVAAPMQGQGLSALVLRVMARLAAAAGLGALLAPVRPSFKDRYPLTPIERYAAWLRDDGLPFDPWLRVHARLGGEVLRCAPRSLEIVADVGRWAEWTGIAFPEDGAYVFPGGLAPLQVAGGVGTYFEPNVWFRHNISAH